MTDRSTTPGGEGAADAAAGHGASGASEPARWPRRLAGLTSGGGEPLGEPEEPGGKPGGEGAADAAAGHTVYLVGAGPGDPLLLTRRAAGLLAAADVVVLDRRSLEAVADLAPVGAERCFVGWSQAGPGWATEQIVDLLADRVVRGLMVVRLKSGDPYVCSRGGEERRALLERGVACDVVPGVTAATAAPLAAGLTRGRTVTIMAGNDDPCYPAFDLGPLADPAASLVVLTGRARQGAIAAALTAAGLAAATPAAVISAATRPGQRVVGCALGDLGRTRLPAPATVVIGPGAAPEDGHAHP